MMPKGRKLYCSSTPKGCAYTIVCDPRHRSQKTLLNCRVSVLWTSNRYCGHMAVQYTNKKIGKIETIHHIVSINSIEFHINSQVCHMGAQIPGRSISSNIRFTTIEMAELYGEENWQQITAIIIVITALPYNVSMSPPFFIIILFIFFAFQGNPIWTVPDDYQLPIFYFSLLQLKQQT